APRQRNQTGPRQGELRNQTHEPSPNRDEPRCGKLWFSPERQMKRLQFLPELVSGRGTKTRSGLVEGPRRRRGVARGEMARRVCARRPSTAFGGPPPPASWGRIF